MRQYVLDMTCKQVQANMKFKLLSCTVAGIPRPQPLTMTDVPLKEVSTEFFPACLFALCLPIRSVKALVTRRYFEKATQKRC